MVPVKRLLEAIFSHVYINKHTKKLEDTTRFYCYLSLSCTFMFMVICTSEAVVMAHHICDKAEIFYVSVIIMPR